MCKLSDLKVGESVVFHCDDFDCPPSKRNQIGKVSEIQSDMVVVVIDDVNYYLTEDILYMITPIRKSHSC